MLYEFRCPSEMGGCGKVSSVSIAMSEYDILKRQIKCCGKPMEPVISGGVASFMRDSFPKGTKITEHCMDEPVFCKDKAQLKDICAETNTVSRYIEDDM